ncbi:MAG: multidrug effflux MFS transporter [Holosporales bacterium]
MKTQNLSVWPIFVAALVTEMATDIYLPAMPQMSRDFNITSGIATHTLTLHLFAQCIASLFYGALSDAHGRRPLLLSGLSLFVLATFAAAFAPNIEWLMVARLAQGLGGISSYVIGLAMVRDVYSEKRALNILSMLYTTLAIGPAIGPIVGGHIAEHWGWRGCFLTIGCIALGVLGLMIVQLQETHTQRTKKAQGPELMRNYKSVMQNSIFMRYALISSIAYGGLWAYLAGSPFFFQDVLRLSPAEYGYFHTFGVVNFILGTTLNRYLLRYLSVHALIRLGLLGLFFTSCSLVVLSQAANQKVWFYAVAMIPYSVGLGLMFSNSNNMALDQCPNVRGTASSVISMMEIVTPILTAWTVGHLYDGSLLPTSLVMLITIIIALGLKWSLSRTRIQNKSVNVTSKNS